MAATVPANFQKTPADIVLLHAGHNHTVEEKPVPQILTNTEALIKAFRRTNPKVVVLLAQPIISSKLPKYSYIASLHAALADLAEKLTTKDSPVVIVPQGEGFDPTQDTIADGVHPNASGAAKMTNRWFDALVTVMDKPPVFYQPEILTYKKTNKGDLTLHLFKPQTPSTTPRPAIIFFYGGGWKVGTPLQFYPECRHFAEKNIVAISADYRTSFTHGTTAFEADSDGGQIAAAAGTVQGLDEDSDDSSISSRPDALALWYPVIDNGPQGYGDGTIKARYQEISPLHHITPDSPPTILFLGTKDPLVPIATARDYQEKMKSAGVRCEVKLFEGAGHPIYEYRKGPSPLRDEILRDIDTFMVDLWD